MCSARRWIRLSRRWDSGSRWPEFSPSDSPLVVKGAERASEDAAAEDERERRSGGELESLGLMLLRRRPTSRSELTRPMSRPKPPLSVEVIGLRAPLALVFDGVGARRGSYSSDRKLPTFLHARSRSSILLCCLLLRCSGMQRSFSVGTSGSGAARGAGGGGGGA